MPANRGSVTARVIVRSNNIGALITRIGEHARAAVDQTATNLRDNASVRAPRDTGSLAASIYVNNGTESDYLQRAATAESLNRDVVILEEIDPEFVISLGGSADAAYASVVGVAAGHGIFQELGTRFQPPQSFLFSAVEVARDEFESLMSHVADA